MDERDERFDVEQILSWEKAVRSKGNQAPFEPDADITLTWEIPYGAFEECRRWVYENRQIVTENETSFDLMDGIWRLKQFVLAPDKTDDGDNYAAVVSAIYSKGYYTTIDWDSARFVELNRSAGNSSTAGVTHGSSHNPQKFCIIRFPFCSPDNIEEMVFSLSATSYTGKVIRDQVLEGEWSNVSASTKLEEDGTHSIYVTLARPQYVLTAYQDLGGVNEDDVVYLWSVPKDLAQGIITAWGVAHPVGASASADYSDERKLVNITLRKKAMEKPNLSLTSIKVSCDTTQNIHFAWGYEEGDISAFIGNHNSELSIGSRQVSVQNRSDGLFDITIVETIPGASSTLPHFLITVPSGSYITNALEYGWNLSITQLVSIKTRLETKVLGKVVTFDVTRQDDCSFDYRASSVVEDEHSSSIASSGNGINFEQKWFKSALVTTGHGLTSGPRKRLSGRARRSDNGLIDYEIEQQTLVEIPQKTLVGSHGNKKIYYGENTTPPTSVSGFIQSAYLTTKDDGTAGHVITVKDPASPIIMENTHKSKGLHVTVKAQIGGSVTDLPTDDESSEVGVQNEVSIRPDDDGSGSWVHEKNEWQPLEKTGVLGGTKLSKNELKVYENQDPDSLDGLSDEITDRGITRGIQFRIDQITGKLSTVIEEQTSLPSTRTVDYEDDGEFKKTIIRQRNVDAEEALSEGEIGRTDSRINDDDKLDVIKETLSMSDKLSSISTQRIYHKTEVLIEHKDWTPTATTKRYKTVSDGVVVISKHSTKFVQAEIKRTRTITVNEFVHYSLDPMDANSGSAPNGAGGGEFESFVDIPKPGLFRRITRTVSVGAWSTPTTANWITVAPDWLIVENEESSTNG